MRIDEHVRNCSMCSRLSHHVLDAHPDWDEDHVAIVRRQHLCARGLDILEHERMLAKLSTLESWGCLMLVLLGAILFFSVRR